jgi:MoxR-like ATPase
MSRHLPTTEEHHPPSAASAAQGHPFLLAAFPEPAAIPLPAAGEVVGREWLADAGIVDTKISGRHARFVRAAGHVQVEDVGSRNGVWIDGIQIAPSKRVGVEDGAILRLGRTLFVYREAFAGEPGPARDLGLLVGPFGLAELRARLAGLKQRPEPNVLLQGETGAGKELVAEAVIEAIGRGRKPHTFVNVTGVPAEVFEGQLFGWRRGAYSGAVADNPGILRAHQGGAVVLDEVGELSIGLQAKILRLVAKGEIQPLGERHPVKVDVALIGATNRPLDAMVEAELFRRDLLARFPVRIEVPPLRERPEDLFAILRALWARRGASLDPKVADVEAVERLMLEKWPANVRDLERLAASVDPAAPLTVSAVERVLGAPSVRAPVTRETVERALAACKGNQSEAARRLGVTRAKVRRLLGLA